MKKIIYLLSYLLFSFTLNAQIDFTVRVNTTSFSNTGGNNYQLVGTIVDANGIWGYNDVAVGDSLFYLEPNTITIKNVIHPFVVNSKSGGGQNITLQLTSVTPLINTSESGTVSGTVVLARKNSKGYISVPAGIANTPIAWALENRFKSKVAVDIDNATEVYVYVGSSGVLPSVSPPTITQHLARNTAKELYQWNGSAWVLVGSGGGLSANSVDSTHIKLRSIAPSDLSQFAIDSLKSLVSSPTLTQNRIGFGSSTNAITNDSTFNFEKWKGVSTISSTINQKQIIGDTTYAKGQDIIFYGNSITESAYPTVGMPTALTVRYPTLVARAFNATEINKGIGGTGLYGATCADSNMLCRYIIPHASTTRYIMFMYGPQNGSSDPTIDVPTYQTKLNALIDSTISKGYPQSKIVILGWILTGRNNSLSDTCVNYRLDTLQQGVASRRGVNFVSTYTYMKLNGALALVSPDSLHPNAKGQAIIAQSIIATLANNRASGYLEVTGKSAFGSDMTVGGDVTIAGNTTTNVANVSGAANQYAIELTAKGAGYPIYSGMRFKGLLSSDSFSLRYETRNGYANVFGLYHNGNANWFIHNNDNVTIGGTTDYGVKLGINGSILANGDANFFPTSNNHSVFNFKNPTFAGNSWIEQKWYGVTTTDTFRNRYGLNGSGDAYYGLFGTAATGLVTTWADGNHMIGFTTNVGSKLAVNGSGRFDGNLLLQPTTATSSTIKMRIPTFSVGNYIEQQFYVNAAGDTVSLRHSIISGGDRLFGIYDDNVPQLVYNATSNNFGIGNNASSTPQYKVDIDAKTGRAGNPLRLQGLLQGATSDSLISSASGVAKRLSIDETIESTHKAYFKTFASSGSVDAGVADVGYDAMTNDQLINKRRVLVFANGQLHPYYHGTSAPSAGTYRALGYWVNGTTINFVDENGSSIATITNVRIEYR